MRLAVICPLLLAACATTPEALRNEAPLATFATTRAEPAIEQCLAEKFARYGGPSVTHGPDRTTLMFGSGGIVSMLIDVTAAEVSVRSGYAVAGRERNQIQACA